MLKHTFIHVPRVGEVTERRLWRDGIKTWEDFSSGNGLSLSPGLECCIRSHLSDSQHALSTGNAAFFDHRLPSSELWRMYPDFSHSSIFLDIETTGISYGWNDVTVIGTYDGRETKVFVKGKNLLDFPGYVKRYAKGCAMLVTYNGRQFDVPFLKAKFPGLELPTAHIDLRFVTNRLGLTGGLKAVERRLDLNREGGLQQVDGFMAVKLWQEYRRGNQSALDTLIRYNLEDVVGLKAIAERAYNMAIGKLPITVQPLKASQRPRLNLPYDPELVTWLKGRYLSYR
ncbi:MAG: ribonuclease H-like domain-containing protein [Candidatus Brocadiales bacterium]